MTNHSPNKIFSNTASQSAKVSSKDRKRKATTEYKDKRRKSKYARTEESIAARKAYDRHDGGIGPDEVIDDISPESLEQLKMSYFETKVSVTPEEAKEIERCTRDQAEDEYWRSERRKRITASSAGGVAKMKESTKRGKKVQALLYSKFHGNAATCYGSRMESTAIDEYIEHQKNGHPNLTVEACGLFISRLNNWLAATPDGIINDPSCTSESTGLVEIKCPFSFRDMTLSEACKKPSFCLTVNKENQLKLKNRHDYWFQIVSAVLR